MLEVVGGGCSGSGVVLLLLLLLVTLLDMWSFTNDRGWVFFHLTVEWFDKDVG